MAFHYYKAVTPVSKKEYLLTNSRLYPNSSFPSQKYKATGGLIGDTGDKKKTFYLNENTVKATKELVSMKQQHELSLGRVTLENVGEELKDMKKEVAGIKGKLTGVEENLRTLLEIMMSRQTGVTQRVN